jgi:MinD-like ATPase involved in chromosome partitioning or flagellar assembly
LVRVLVGANDVSKMLLFDQLMKREIVQELVRKYLPVVLKDIGIGAIAMTVVAALVIMFYLLFASPIGHDILLVLVFLTGAGFLGALVRYVINKKGHDEF